MGELHGKSGMFPSNFVRLETTTATAPAAAASTSRPVPATPEAAQPQAAQPHAAEPHHEEPAPPAEPGARDPPRFRAAAYRTDAQRLRILVRPRHSLIVFRPPLLFFCELFSDAAAPFTVSRIKKFGVSMGGGLPLGGVGAFPKLKKVCPCRAALEC